MFESDVYVVVHSKAAVRQAIEEIGGLAVDNVDDTCNELGQPSLANWVIRACITSEDSCRILLLVHSIQII